MYCFLHCDGTDWGPISTVRDGETDKRSYERPAARMCCIQRYQQLEKHRQGSSWPIRVVVARSIDFVVIYIDDQSMRAPS